MIVKRGFVQVHFYVRNVVTGLAYQVIVRLQATKNVQRPGGESCEDRSSSAVISLRPSCRNWALERFTRNPDVKDPALKSFLGNDVQR